MKVAIFSLVCVGALLLSGADGSSPTALGGGDAATCLRPEDASFAGVDSCKKCHFKQWMSWKKTEMAKAFDTLKPGEAAEAKTKFGLDLKKDYTQDATCLPCHTTGYGKPGGYPALEKGKDWTEDEKKRAGLLTGVQCESCHGPGSVTNVFKKDNEQYKRAEILERGMIAPNRDNCVTCHNEKSPTITKDQPFDYEAAIKDKTKIHEHVPLKFEH